MSRIGALQLRDAVLDEGSFRSWDSPPLEVDASEAYRRELAAAKAATGLDESVVTGEGTVFGRRVALVACEFDFLAGSIGVAAAERITAAVRAGDGRAAAAGGVAELGRHPHAGGHRRVPADGQDRGGRRTAQAGAPALSGVSAASDHRRGVRVVGFARPRHRAEPGALVGFLGPRVYEHLYGEPFPAGVQTAENLHRHGVIDGVVPLDALRSTLDRALKVVADPPERAASLPTAEPMPDVPAWESVEASRRPDRPGVGYLLRHGTTERVLLSGTGAARRPPRCWRWPGSAVSPPSCWASSASSAEWSGPAALREARRGMALAAGLQLPLVLVIDTAGPGAVRRGRAGWAGR